MAASAEYTEEVHDDWHEHNDTFTIDNVNYVVKSGGSMSKVLVVVNGEGVIVENGTCIDRFNMSICLDDVKYPEGGLHRIYRPEDYEYRVRIEYHLADLTIEKIVGDTELLMGKTTLVEVTIQNVGSLEASNIHFKDVYTNFSIISVGGCSFGKNNVTWEGFLFKNQRKTCSFYIKAKEPITLNSKATAVYSAGIGNRTRTAESNEITITVPAHEMVLSTNLSNTTVWAGENFTYNATLENIRDDVSLQSIGFSVQIPKGIDIIEYSPSMRLSGKTVVWTGTLSSENKKDLWIRLSARHSGEKTIRSYVNYNVGNLERRIEKNNTLDIKIDKLAMQYISFGEKTLSEARSMLIVNLNNPSSTYKFRNIDAQITTDLPIELNSSSFEEIGIKQFRGLILKNITLPEVKDITNYKIRFSIGYESEYGERMMINETKTIIVSPKTAPEQQGVISKLDISGTIKEEIEKIGKSRFFFWAIAFIIVFAFSLFHFFMRMVKKVKEYEVD